MKELNPTTFLEFIKSDKKVIVDFYGPKCPACETLLPYLERVREEHPNRIAKIDATEEMEILIKYGVRNIPNMLVFQNNVLVRRRVGSVNHVDKIRELLE